MADYINDLISDGKTWEELDLSIFPVGTILTVQNKGRHANIFYGPTAPAGLRQGVDLPSYNWPLHEGVVESKVFWRGTRMHFSAGV